MPQTFDCPKCGAPVTYEPPSDLSARKTTARCEYCHSQLIAPNELAGRPAQVVQIKFGLSEGSKFPKWIWNGIFKFARDGKFINRFGSDGDQAGQFRAPYSIGVDGYGRVYVGDMKGIQVFDANGRYLSLINVKGMAFGMVFNDKNELFVIARDHVVKYSVAAQ